MQSRLFLCWYALASCAQVAPHPPISGAIAGTILDRESNRPIRRVVVTLSTVETQPQDAVAWSDSAGHFVFENLPAGRYQLRAQKSGYRDTRFGMETPDRPPAILVLAEGENRSDLVIRLQHFGVISGVVMDEDGEPVENADVVALMPAFQRGERKLRQTAQARTDREGRYRIDGLPAGSYAVVARHSGEPVTKSQPEASAGTTPHMYVHGIQYHPGTDRARSAALLAIQGGNEIEGIDFRLPSLPLVSLQVKVVAAGEVNPNSIMVTALREELFDGPNVAGPVALPDLKFEFVTLTAGSYQIIALASVDGRQYRGMQHVQVAPEAPEVTVALEPAVDLAGVVSVEGPGSQEHAALHVRLIPEGAGLSFRQTGPLEAIVNRDGTFKVMNVPPGVWDINVGPIPPNGYLKSMELGKQDVLTEDMVVSSKTTETLKIVLSTQAARVTGSVKGTTGPAGRAAVVLAPEGKFRQVLSFYELTASDETGHFEVKGATPGTYKLYAFEELNPSSLADPEFLKPFEQFGVLVRLDEGRSTSQDITLISAGAGGK